MPNRTIFSLNRTIFSVVKIALIALYLVPYSHLICSLLAPYLFLTRTLFGASKDRWMALIRTYFCILIRTILGQFRTYVQASSYSHYLNNRAIWMRLWPNSANKRKIPPGLHLFVTDIIYMICSMLYPPLRTIGTVIWMRWVYVANTFDIRQQQFETQHSPYRISNFVRLRSRR